MTITINPRIADAVTVEVGTGALSALDNAATTLPSVHAVRSVAGRLLQQLAGTELDDPRWSSAGPLVTAAAGALRRALGMPVTETRLPTPDVVREADFARAARPLLAGQATLVDPVAGREFVRMATRALVAIA